MRSRLAVQLISCVMMVVVPAALMAAETNGAILYSSGSVHVNRNAVATSTAVFAGDVLATSADGALTVSAAGSSLFVPANSTVVYQGKAVNVEQGSAVVTTQRRMGAHVADVTITPATPEARYSVTAAEGKIQITALSGKLLLRDAHENLTLDAGNTATRAAAPPQGTVPAASGGTGMSNWAVAAIGIAVSVAVAVAAAVATRNKVPLSGVR